MKKEAAQKPEMRDPLAWARYYLPEFFSDESCEFHRELMADLADSDKRLLARVAPRGHAKSTCASFAFPLWCVCTQRRRNILILTHERSLAVQFVRDIRNELESNERLMEDYSDFFAVPPTGKKPKSSAVKAPRRPRRSTTQSVFTTSSGITVQAKGSGASLRGVRVGPQRPDLIICDDLEKDQLVESPEQRRKLENWLRKVVMPALAPGGRLIVLGSILHHDALLANLADRSRWPRWDYRVYRALEARAVNDQGGYELVALWPARWNVAQLKEERERIGTLAFEQEYQANPIDDSLRVFRPEWLRRFDESELVPERLVNLVCVDPATGVAGGDFFALWAGSVDTQTGVIYTRVLALERIGIVAQVQRILAAFDRWKPVRIGIETTAYQSALQQALAEEGRRRGLYLPITPIQAHANKRARIEGLAPLFENGTFRLPRTLDPEAETQFLHFPKARHDDAPDVCAMALGLAASLRSLRTIDVLPAAALRPAGDERTAARRRDW